MPGDTQELAKRTAALLKRYGELAGRWSPLPHQIPPPPGFYGWLLLAGRGAGKTDTCANYMVRHVQGPPCLKGPHPHWMGIIGPTLGDAATSCFSGPSGISAHDPSAVMVTTKGGTIVRWPNGSEAKLFGAHTEDEVDRLRSGGNRSIAVGTLIRTERGEIPIEQVTTSDRVWTRLGLRPVLGSWDHGTRPLWTLRTRAGRELRLTPDHKVWTQRGWVRCDALRVGDTLSSWNMEVTAGSVWARTGPGRFEQETSTAQFCSIDRSTKITTDPSQRGIRSTIKITTSRTTLLRTSKPNRLAITTAIMTKGRSGTLLAVDRPDGTRSLIALASSAERSFTDTVTPDSVLGNAGAHISFRQPPVCSHAVCAEAVSQSKGSPLLSRAPDAVETISPGNAEGAVWDLTIAGEHEFFAGDLLVANCLQWLEEMAAWRYLDTAWHHMRFGLRSGPRPHWIGSTTPKPRPLIKKLDRGEFENVAITHASMYDNPHLPEEIRRALEEAYAGTDLGAQELEGRILDQDANALWKRSHIERNRIDLDVLRPMLKRITVGVDPSGGAGEQGIVAVGKTGRIELPGFANPVEMGAVLSDASVCLPAAGWGKRVVDTAIEWDADDICVEKNFGGDMAIETVRASAEKRGIAIPIRFVVASRGKIVRAAPVGALTEQDRFKFAGTFEDLETQLCTWTPELDYSPDRLDAMVWGPHHLKLVHLSPAGQGTIGSSAARKVIGDHSGGRPVPPEAAREQYRTRNAVGGPGRHIG